MTLDTQGLVAVGMAPSWPLNLPAVQTRKAVAVICAQLMVSLGRRINRYLMYRIAKACGNVHSGWIVPA